MLRRLIHVGLSVLVLLLTSRSPLLGVAWNVNQITDNRFDDQAPNIAGEMIAWQGRGNIFLYDGSTTKQLTTDGRNAFSSLSDSSVVWSSGTGTSREIFFYDGTTKQITNNGMLNIHPRVSGQNITWLGISGDTYGVYFSDGVTTRLLSSSASEGTRPKISGSVVVWPEFDGHDLEIMKYDGSQVSQLTDNDYEDNSPTIEGNKIAWLTNSRSRIAFYDGDTLSEIDPGSRVNRMRISGENIAWDSVAPPGRDEEVFFYDGVTTTQLTDNDERDFFGNVSGNNVVWYQGIEDASEVFVYDGMETTQLTNNAFSDLRPRVSGETVVWWGSDGHDEEVYVARPVPEPASLAVWLAMGAIAAAAAVLRAKWRM